MANLTDKFLEKLRDNSQRLSIGSLQSLSGLDKAGIAALQKIWPTMEVGRRRQIVHALVELAEENVELDFTSVFKSCIDDPDAEVREAAVEGLWEDTGRDTATLLIRVLTTDPDPAVRAQAASSLSHFAYMYEVDELDRDTGNEVKTALLETIRNGSEELDVRRRAVEAISYLSDEVVTSLLIWAYNSAEVKMRVSAVRGMGRNCDPRWLPNIFQELHSPNPELRFEAAQACGELEDKRCVPKLVPLLADDDLEVRLAAVYALGHIGGRAAKKALLSILEKGEDESMQEAASEALEEVDFYEDPLGFHV